MSLSFLLKPVVGRLRQYLPCIFTLLSIIPALSQGSGSAVILQYHHVSHETPKITSVTPETFRKHINYLAENKFNVMPLVDLVETLRNKKALPEKTVAISFDDAYLSIYTEAFPILREQGLPFTIFVTPAPVDKNYQKFLSWAQLREMTEAGATLANHTMHHAHSVERLPGETRAQWLSRFRQDLDMTEARIREQTGQSVKMFAWTFGETTPELRATLDEMGYTGFGQQSGAAGEYSDFTRLPRFPMAGIYGVNDFAIKVNSRALPVTSQSPDSSLITQDNLKPELKLTLAEGDYQKKQLKCYASGQGELKVTWLNKEMTLFRTQANKPLPVGRTRYNCTAPSNSGRHYFWYSHAWLRLTDEGKALD
ncbi:polysaccharide deacetylase family protein [Endozoicomonas sp. ALB091]|uniref:polysaccharide deacetylase family protein n=1 Tax=Endozoicomonas sp. ALB091 TaxID=3403073 RepID=UPI003BB4E5ED